MYVNTQWKTKMLVTNIGALYNGYNLSVHIFKYITDMFSLTYSEL